MELWSFSYFSEVNSTSPIKVIDEIDSGINIDTNGKIIHFYSNNWSLHFHENDRPSEFVFITNMKFPELKERGGIEWDEKGKETYNPYAAIGKSFWDDVDCGEAYLENLKRTKIEILPISTAPPEGYRLYLPKKLIDSDVSKTFKSIIKYDKDVRSGRIRPLLKFPGFENLRRSDDRYLRFYFHKENLAQLLLYCLQKNHHFGCRLDYDEKNRLLAYVYGEMSEIKSDKTEVTFSQCVLDGDGIEIKFHLTGYPTSYKTIINNCLQGRQMEWNENGEVVSDVNLDTPQPWSDAPKKTDNVEK